MTHDGPAPAPEHHRLSVGAWMSERPVVIRADATVREARRLLDGHRIRHLPVVAAGRCVGLLSDRGLRLAVATRSRGDDRQVRDVLHGAAETIRPSAPLAQAAELMRAHGVDGLAVVEGWRLVGVITETDVLRAMVELLGLTRTSVRIHFSAAAGDRPLWAQLRSIEQRGLVVTSLLAFGAPDSPEFETVVRATARPGAS